MQQKVYLLVTNRNKDIVQNIHNGSKVYLNPYNMNESKLTETTLHKLAMMCNTEYFYVISTEGEITFPVYEFDYIPPEWDKEYVHIWNNDTTVRLYSKSMVLNKPWDYDDVAIAAGAVKFKHHAGKLYDRPYSDIVFISYDEYNADENYQHLLKRFPKAKRVHGIKGICKAHKEAANIASSDMFFVVDADAEILPEFDFTFQPSSYDRRSVHVWHSINPINDLEYGYGAVKLFPTTELRNFNGSPIDFTTSVSKSLKVVPIVSNITKFNTDPFSSWKSGFREAVKLRLLALNNNQDAISRLDVWATKGEDREFGDFVIAGVHEGIEYADIHKDTPELIGRINDFTWLQEKFST